MLELVENVMLQHIESVANEKTVELYKKLPKGKRLRAKLILKIAGKDETALELAAIIELIHAASLLHDDVIDEADTRRGLASINSTYGDLTAIMLGDILYSKAFTRLTFLPNQVARHVADAVTKLSVGELMDVELAKCFNKDLDAYFDMIYKKTASLIESAAFCAACIAQKDTEKYASYGKNLGLAFQIIDDILDVTQSSEVLGKPAMNDFKEGKTTLPYIYLYDSLDEKGKERLLSLFGKNLKKDDTLWIKDSMFQHKSIEKSVLYAKELADEALKSIQDEDAQDLEEIITQMIDRSF